MDKYERQRFLSQHIPYRLHQISLCMRVCAFMESHADQHRLVVQFGDKLKIESGNISLFTNPVIEIGLVMCRTMFEFMGVKVARQKPLEDRDYFVVAKRDRNSDDVICEDFGVKAVTPEQLREDIFLKTPFGLSAEKIVCRTIRTASKGVAHLTRETTPQVNIHELKSTCFLADAVINSYFYKALGLPEVVFPKFDQNIEC